MNAILIDGLPIAMKSTVKTWHQTSLDFPALGKRSETNAVGLHWTGGEGGGAQVHRVLKLRGLSVHFLVDQEGVIWQYADAGVRCSHIGSANSTTVGIEISNRANGKDHVRYPRERYQERVHGHKFFCSSFYPAQVAATKELTEMLCKAYGLPFVTPAVDTCLDPRSLKLFRGVLGHFHVTRRKVDPGIRLLRELGLDSSP